MPNYEMEDLTHRISVYLMRLDGLLWGFVFLILAFTLVTCGSP